MKPIFAKVQTLSVMEIYRNYWIMLKENSQAKNQFTSNAFPLTNACCPRLAIKIGATSSKLDALSGELSSKGACLLLSAWRLQSLSMLSEVKLNVT